jgi:TetR/AcrR family transcriptional regulator, cholesterol catabolism regulator
MAKPKSNKKEIILERSSELFRTRGYSATSMRDIADAVGMEAASLYNHIRSKSDLLQEIVFAIAVGCNQHLEEVTGQTGSSTAKIEAVIRFHIRLMITRFNEYYVMTHDWHHLAEPHLVNFAQQRRAYVQQLEAIIETGIAAGEFRNIIPYVAVLNILSAVMGLEFWQRSAKRYSEQEMEDNIVLHLLSGLKNG